MTRQTLPEVCDLCAKDIKSGQQYVFEVFQGKKTFADELTKGKTMDCCHTCFMKACKNGYKPDWKYQVKNPNYKPGSKVANEKYWIFPTEGEN